MLLCDKSINKKYNEKNKENFIGILNKKHYLMQNKTTFMKIKNSLITLSFLIIGMLFVACSSDEDINQDARNNKKKYAVYAFSFNSSDISNLKEGDSVQVTLTPEYISGNISQVDVYNKLYKVKTKSPIVPMVGTITDLGNKRVSFKRNSGENLVPYYFTGPTIITICRVWKISLEIDLPDESVSVRGFTGEFTGWDLQYRGNTQKRTQNVNGPVSKPTYSTYVYKLISDINGVNLGRDLYLPIKPGDARIYVKFYYD